jgi:hypothetical protein
MSRETEVADYLRADAALRALAPGGIYPDAMLPESGLTNAKLVTKVWAGGVFNTTIVVRERAPVPTGDLQSTASQHTSMSQAIEVWGYGKTADAVEAALNRVYALMMGKRFNRAFSATWVGGGLGIMQAPELPAGIKTHHEDYRIVTIRRPVRA